MTISGLPNSFGAKLTYIRIIDGDMDRDVYNIESDLANLLATSFSDECRMEEFQDRADKLYASLKKRAEAERASGKNYPRDIENLLLKNNDRVKGLPRDFGAKLSFIRALDGDTENDRFNIESDMINLLAQSFSNKCDVDEFQKQALNLYKALVRRESEESNHKFNYVT